MLLVCEETLLREKEGEFYSFTKSLRGLSSGAPLFYLRANTNSSSSNNSEGALI